MYGFIFKLQFLIGIHDIYMALGILVYTINGKASFKKKKNNILVFNFFNFQIIERITPLKFFQSLK